MRFESVRQTVKEIDFFKSYSVRLSVFGLHYGETGVLSDRASSDQRRGNEREEQVNIPTTVADS